MIVNWAAGVPFINVLPSQKYTRAEKIKEFGDEDKWAVANMESIENLYRNASFSRVHSYIDKYDMTINMRMIEEGYYDVTEFIDLLKPYGSNKDYKFPVDVNHYDVLTDKFELLRGEEEGRPFKFVAVNMSEDGASMKQEKQASMVYRLLIENLMRTANTVRPGTMPEEYGDGIPVNEGMLRTKEDIDRYMKYKYSDIAEDHANHVLKYLFYEDNLAYKFNKNFLRFLATGVEIYWVGIIEGEPRVRVVDPRLFDCDMSHEADYIEKAAHSREIRYLTAAEVHDEFHSVLSDEDVQLIENRKGNYFNTFRDYGYYGSFLTYGNTTLIRVAHFEWKSLRKIGFKKYFDVNDVQQIELIDEDYKYEPKAGETVEWHWVTERWQGTKIGDSIYVGMQPVPNQYRNLENPSISSGSYVGVRTPYSLAAKVRPYQLMYNTIMHRLMLTFARAKGKIMVLDYAQLPKSLGWDMDKWMYFADVFGFAVINSLEGANEGQKSSFNQYTEIDMTLSDSVAQYINQLDFINRVISDITGITKQRQGQVMASETASGVEQSRVASMAITENYFFLHNDCKRRVLQHLIDVAKIAYKGGKRVQYIGSDLGRVFIELDPSLKYSDIGVFISDSQKDLKLIEQLREAAMVALQQQTVTLEDWADAMGSQSIAELKSILGQAEDKRKEREAQSQQSQQQATQMQQQIAQEQLGWDKEKFQLELKKDYDLAAAVNETRIRQAEINAEGQIVSKRADIDADINRNGVLDVYERDKMQLEREALQLKREELRTKTVLERQKMGHEMELKDKELELKKQEKDHDIAKERETRKTLEAKTAADTKKVELHEEKLEHQMEYDNHKAKLEKEKPKESKKD